ncbi:MAG: metal-dependent hydrolase [Gammaproteobacteria bacterium]|nr:metal-dependent hydrolase [Gammaproteobacteria bacterium]
MPFTPIHMGPGILIKSILQSSFSLMVFGWAQIIMDIQPLIVMLTGEGHLHGFTHTYLGALLLTIVSALTGKHLSEYGLIILGIAKKDNPISIKWWVVFVSAFIGTFSHVFLDSIMHYDIEPFYPWIANNYLHNMITINQLHQFCLYSGLVGAAIYYLIQLQLKKESYHD